MHSPPIEARPYTARYSSFCVHFCWMILQHLCLCSNVCCFWWCINVVGWVTGVNIKYLSEPVLLRTKEENWGGGSRLTNPLTYNKYSLDFLRPITTAEAFEAVDWLADLPQRTWPEAAGRWSDVIFDIILLKSTAAILAAAMFVGDRTTASTSLAGMATVD